MQRPSTDFSSELRLPLQWAAGALAVFGWFLAVTVDPRLDSSSQLRLVLIGTLIFATAIIAWRLDSRNRRTSHWLVIGLSIGAVLLVHQQWQFPGFLALLGIPAALAAPLISVQAMWAVAATESLLLAAGFVLDLTTLGKYSLPSPAFGRSQPSSSRLSDRFTASPLGIGTSSSGSRNSLNKRATKKFSWSRLWMTWCRRTSN